MSNITIDGCLCGNFGYHFDRPQFALLSYQ